MHSNLTSQSVKEYGEVVLAFWFYHNEDRIPSAGFCINNIDKSYGQNKECPKEEHWSQDFLKTS